MCIFCICSVINNYQLHQSTSKIFVEFGEYFKISTKMFRSTFNDLCFPNLDFLRTHHQAACLPYKIRTQRPTTIGQIDNTSSKPLIFNLQSTGNLKKPRLPNHIYINPKNFPSSIISQYSSPSTTDRTQYASFRFFLCANTAKRKLCSNCATHRKKINNRYMVLITMSSITICFFGTTAAAFCVAARQKAACVFVLQRAASWRATRLTFIQQIFGKLCCVCVRASSLGVTCIGRGWGCNRWWL